MKTPLLLLLGLVLALPNASSLQAAEIWLDADGDGLPDSDTLAIEVGQPVTVGIWIDSESYTWTNFLAFVEYGDAIEVDSAAYTVSGGGPFPIDDFSVPNAVGLGGYGYSESGVTQLGNLYVHATASGVVCLAPRIDTEAEPFSQLGVDTSYALFSEAAPSCVSASEGDSPDGPDNPDEPDSPGEPATPSLPLPVPGALEFIENKGQLPEAVKFYIPGGHANLFLTDEGTVLDRFNVERNVHEGEIPPDLDTLYVEGVVLETAFEGASGPSSVTGDDVRSGVRHFLLSSDSTEWVRDVSAFSQVTYEDVYDGIDLVYYVSNGTIKYDFVLAAGASPDSIRLRYSGADSLTINEFGQLVCHTAMGTLVEAAPEVFQGTNVIPSEYTLLDSTLVGFTVGEYNPGQSLIVDPRLVWSTFIGGTSGEAVYQEGIARDSLGSIYIVGDTFSTNFPTTPGAYQQTFAGGLIDGIVAKFSGNGATREYVTYLGGSAADHCYAVAADDSTAFVSGFTVSTNFPRTTGAFDTTHAGTTPNQDAFVAHLNAAGNDLVYSTFLGGTGLETCDALALLPNGSVIVGGSTTSPEFPTTPGVYDSTHNANGTTDLFVTRFNATGSALDYSTFIGGSPPSQDSHDMTLGLAVRDDGAPCVTGYTQSSVFPTTVGAYDRTYNGGLEDCFLLELEPDFSGLRFSTYLGGSGRDQGYGVHILPSGNIAVCGWTLSSNLPWSPGAVDTTYGDGGGDGFVAVVSASGGERQALSYLGGSGLDVSRAIGSIASGDLVIHGDTKSTDWTTSPDAADGSLGGISDATLVRMNASCTAMEYSTFVGGSSYDYGFGMVVDQFDFAYMTGWTQSGDFPVTPGSYDQTHNGEYDVWVMSFYIGDSPTIVEPVSAEGSDRTRLWLRASPNPFAGTGSLRLDIGNASAGRVEASVFDLSGRRVRRLLDESLQASERSFTWDGTDADRRPLPSGVYVIMVQSGDERSARTIVITR
jgi:FlgD Ig-like domain/Beta-propeller repeat